MKIPVPEPRSGETQDDFISRCMSALAKTDANRPQKQRVAMCFTSWREKEQVGPATPGSNASPDKWSDKEKRCNCRKCGNSINRPGSGCREATCPRCGHAMYNEARDLEWMVPPRFRKAME